MAWGFWLIIGIVIACVLFFGIALGIPERPPRRPSISKPVPRPSSPRPQPGLVPVAVRIRLGGPRA